MCNTHNTSTNLPVAGRQRLCGSHHKVARVLGRTAEDLPLVRIQVAAELLAEHVTLVLRVNERMNARQ